MERRAVSPLHQDGLATGAFGQPARRPPQRVDRLTAREHGPAHVGADTRQARRAGCAILDRHVVLAAHDRFSKPSLAVISRSPLWPSSTISSRSRVSSATRADIGHTLAFTMSASQLNSGRLPMAVTRNRLRRPALITIKRGHRAVALPVARRGQADRPRLRSKMQRGLLDLARLGRLHQIPHRRGPSHPPGLGPGFSPCAPRRRPATAPASVPSGRPAPETRDPAGPPAPSRRAVAADRPSATSHSQSWSFR
ncbi:hypothetical protein Ddc_23895 [Ditylenchus destructor]|nr:hypothetical protein Ddc_23895 [Ditylenchus destructor]